MSASLTQEIKATFRIAVPVIMTQVGFLTMQVVDAIMAGRAGPAQLAAVGAGSAPHYMVFVFGMGLLFSLDTVVSQAYGAGNLERCRRAVMQGLWLALIAAIALTPIQLVVAAHYQELTGADPTIAVNAAPYLSVLSWSIGPILGCVALQRYWQAQHVVMPMFWVTIAANLLNALGCYVLVLGHWGFPAMGAVGTAWSTLACRTLMFVSMAIYTWVKDPAFRRLSRSLEKALLSELFCLGAPAGFHFLFEVGAFAIASTLAARLGTAPMGAHHSVLQIASFTFMFPVGFAAAASVRVGNAVGAGRWDEAKRAGWIGIVLAAAVMTLSAIVLFTAGSHILSLFSSDPGVLVTGTAILFIAGVFQVFDGVQVAAAGALRGWGDTRSAMVANGLGHYPIGLALATTLCFHFDMGLRGIWIGLATGLVAVATGLTWRWNQVSARTRQEAVI